MSFFSSRLIASHCFTTPSVSRTSLVAENMRMPPDEFCASHPSSTSSILNRPFSSAICACITAQQNQVAQFFAQIGLIVRRGRRPRLRTLPRSDPGRSDLVGLLAVPRAAIGRAELGDDFAKLAEGEFELRVVQ